METKERKIIFIDWYFKEFEEMIEKAKNIGFEVECFNPASVRDLIDFLVQQKDKKPILFLGFYLGAITALDFFQVVSQKRFDIDLSDYSWVAHSGDSDIFSRNGLNLPYKIEKGNCQQFLDVIDQELNLGGSQVSEQRSFERWSEELNKIGRIEVDNPLSSDEIVNQMIVVMSEFEVDKEDYFGHIGNWFHAMSHDIKKVFEIYKRWERKDVLGILKTFYLKMFSVAWQVKQNNTNEIQGNCYIDRFAGEFFESFPIAQTKEYDDFLKEFGIRAENATIFMEKIPLYLAERLNRYFSFPLSTQLQEEIDQARKNNTKTEGMWTEKPLQGKNNDGSYSEFDLIRAVRLVSRLEIEPDYELKELLKKQLYSYYTNPQDYREVQIKKGLEELNVI